MGVPPIGGSDEALGEVLVGATTGEPGGVEVTSGETGDGRTGWAPGFTQALLNTIRLTSIRLTMNNLSHLSRHTKATLQQVHATLK